MSELQIVLFAAAAFVLSIVLTRALCRPGSFLYLLDHPNERSLHTHPVPRTGGIAIVVAVVTASLALAIFSGDMSLRIAWLALAMAVVGIVSFVDDRGHFPPGYRIAAHLLAATVLVFAGFVIDGEILPGINNIGSPMWFAISCLYIVWSINLYNFMDGMDGFAGGMAVVGFSTFAVLGWADAQLLFAASSAIIAAAAAGFLFFNFPPARIFMGDTGSSTLGLLVAAFSIWGTQSGVFPFWVALLIFSPFIVDATVTLLVRAAKGEKIWQAHRTHHYQRLVQLGWGHRRTVLWEYTVMIACAGSALIALRTPLIVQWAIVSGWVVTYVCLVFIVRRLERDKRALGT